MPALHQRFLHDVSLRRDHLRRDGRHHRQDHAHERGAGQPHRARDGWLLEVGEAARHQFLPPILLQLCRRARAARVRGRGALLPGVVLLREGEALRRRALGRNHPEALPALVLARSQDRGAGQHHQRPGICQDVPSRQSRQREGGQAYDVGRTPPAERNVPAARRRRRL